MQINIANATTDNIFSPSQLSLLILRALTYLPENNKKRTTIGKNKSAPQFTTISALLQLGQTASASRGLFDFKTPFLPNLTCRN